MPILIDKSPQIQKLVFDLAEHKRETKDWFHEILNELRQDREQQARKWEEQNRELNEKWKQQDQKFDSLDNRVR